MKEVIAFLMFVAVPVAIVFHFVVPKRIAKRVRKAPGWFEECPACGTREYSDLWENGGRRRPPGAFPCNFPPRSSRGER